MAKNGKRIFDSLNIIWTIAMKDIVDALKSKLVVSLILVGSVVLFLPKMASFFFDQPVPVLPVLDAGDSILVATLEDNPDISVQPVQSEEELIMVLCNAMYPEIGLLLPSGGDQALAANGEIELQGVVCWNRRHQVSGLETDLEDLLAQSFGQPVDIQVDGNIVYSPADGALLSSITVVNIIVVILAMGIVLVPNLMFEEKQAKTMQALLVSPASISQVVIGKALAGLFYILVIAVAAFVISWADVVHWSVVVLFIMVCGFFSVGAGLVLGSFYEKPQDIAGWITALLVAFIGAVFVKMIGLKLPDFVNGILAWMPSVALAEIYRASFLETVSLTQIGLNTGIVLVVSLPLYALVIWKVRRSDR